MPETKSGQKKLTKELVVMYRFNGCSTFTESATWGNTDQCLRNAIRFAEEYEKAIGPGQFDVGEVKVERRIIESEVIFYKSNNKASVESDGAVSSKIVR